MRPLTGERGAVSLFVVLLIVPLIGFGALAIDISSLYQERRELQNGADAGALAVAKDCAEASGCIPSVAQTYADANANDGRSGVDEVCGTGPNLPACASPPTVPAGTEYVRVTTDTFEVGGAVPEQMNFKLAPVLALVSGDSFDGQAVRASAVAAWGSPSGATTLPLTFSLCEYRKFVPTPASLQTGPPFTGPASVIYHHSAMAAETCPTGPAGFNLPGGFGWLQVGSDCEAAIEVGDWVADRTGVAAPGCLDLTLLRNTVVLLPVYDVTNGLPGTNGEYHIVGFAAFYLTGYRFPSRVWPAGFQCPEQPGSSGTCLRGHFTTLTTTGTDFGGPDLGVTIIRLVG